MSGRTLYLLADNFSNQTRECFFEKELPYLCDRFRYVKVVSLYPKDNAELGYRANNLEVLTFDYFAPCNRPKTFLTNLIPLIFVFCYEFLKTHDRVFYLRNFRKCFNQLILAFGAANRLKDFIKKDLGPETVFYSYWFKQWAFALSLISLKDRSIKFVSRVHGGDYDEGQIRTVLPFRYFQLSRVVRIFPVSDFGRNYLIEHFRVNPSKIRTSRLGLGSDPFISDVDPELLNIVSCSSVIPLKRVYLIPEILRHVNVPVKWVHFGTGDLFEDLRRQCNGLQVNVELKGYVTNQEFIAYLKTNPVSLFINVSESEGIPVSMMEAISNGIPLAGPDICGIPEIVTEETGFLFPVDFSPADVASAIEKRHLEKSFYLKQTRQRVSRFYKEFFYTEKNHRAFADHLAHV